ncbi:putative transposase [Candidatus Protofrankia californiensis]|uniref:Putative transposase n=1 Tax=Candidatus Protofrankia californiensis TaxID=1839754 RepID=A0A1C3P0U0_9ACTN|nr:putative transposase [Candidatus Protofrankia californiensis]
MSIELSPAEREVLEGWARRRKTAQALAQRSRIVLACAEGQSNAEVTEALSVSRPTVTKWRNRFAVDRLDGLSDKPRPGAPRKVTDAQVETVITRTLEETPPNGDSHGTSRSMASGLSQSTVSWMWRAFGLKPHLVETWKLSTDPQFVDKVRDVVGVYLDPPGKAIVLCVDEKSQIQALDRTADVLPMMPGTPERMTHGYVRHGTTSLFAVLDPTSGSVITQSYRRHRHQEFLRFLKLIDSSVPAGYDLHLILDNYATYKTEPVKRWLLRHPRFHLHFTPTSASWMNLVERWAGSNGHNDARRSGDPLVILWSLDIPIRREFVLMVPAPVGVQAAVGRRASARRWSTAWSMVRRAVRSSGGAWGWSRAASRGLRTRSWTLV